MKIFSWFHDFKRIKLVWGINSRNGIFCQKLTWSHVPNKGRSWNVFSPKTCFWHFLGFWSYLIGHQLPRTSSLYTNRFISWRTSRSFFPRSSSSIRGERAQGLYQPPSPRVPWKMTKMTLPARVNPYKAGVDSGVGVDSGGSESESTPEGRSRSHMKTHRLCSPGIMYGRYNCTIAATLLWSCHTLLSMFVPSILLLYIRMLIISLFQA